jgi:hypothetical protein
MCTFPVERVDCVRRLLLGDHPKLYRSIGNGITAIETDIISGMPPTMEDPYLVNAGPRPLEPFPFASYDVQLASGDTAKMVPVHDQSQVSVTLVAYLTQEMNEEVCSIRKM